MNFGVDLSDASCIVSSTESCFTFTNAAMNFTIEQFEQDLALEVFIGKEIQAGTNYKSVKILFSFISPLTNCLQNSMGPCCSRIECMAHSWY